LRCAPRTGRQHQLRAHLQAIGLPLVGDKLYGPDDSIFLRMVESGTGPAPAGQFDALLTPEERAALRMPRHALHAAELEVPHPVTGEPRRFESPLPADLRELIDSLSAVDT
jgi:23S rRNA pseudouridine1911/1915/1917 synthase